MLDQPVACLCLRSFYSVEVLKLVHHCRALGLKDMQRVLLVVDILSCRTRTYVHVICILICNMVHIYVHVHVHLEPELHRTPTRTASCPARDLTKSCVLIRPGGGALERGPYGRQISHLQAAARRPKTKTMSNPRTYLLTGATGRIGKYIARCEMISPTPRSRWPTAPLVVPGTPYPPIESIMA